MTNQRTAHPRKKYPMDRPDILDFVDGIEAFWFVLSDVPILRLYCDATGLSDDIVFDETLKSTPRTELFQLAQETYDTTELLKGTSDMSGGSK